MRRRLLTGVVLAALLIGLVDLYRSDRALFRYPSEKLQRATARVLRALPPQIALLYTTDDLPGSDWISGQPVELAETMSRRGKFGTALHLDGRRRSFAILPLRWSELGPSFTLSLWLRLDAASPDQEILFSREDAPLGLKLDRGRMTFFLTSPGQPPGLSFAFTNAEQFVHLAVVVDAEAGTTRLYENGLMQAEMKGVAYAASHGRLTLGRASSEVIADPLMGDVDEVIVWRSALSSNEVAALAGQDRAALAWLAPKAWRSYQFARGLQSVIQRTLKLVDLFNPAMHPARARRNDLPEISMVLSKKDAKAVIQSHRRALRDGQVSSATADSREIDMVERGRAIRATLRLTDGVEGDARCARRAYVLEPAAGETVLGLSRVRLMPPETAGWLKPLLETEVAHRLGIPTISNGLCRLLINGESAGLYYYEDYATLGVPNGFGARRFEGVSTRDRWTRLSLPEPPALSRDELLTLRDQLTERYRAWLVRDAKSPLSGREIQYRLREDKRRVERWPLNERALQKSPARRLTEDGLTAFFVLGSNRSPDFLVHDLDLRVKLPEGTTLRWTAHDPAVLSAEGRITPPTNGVPQAARLTAHVADGTFAGSVDLNFRVMPSVRALPALFLWTDTVLQRLARVHAAVEYVPAATNEPVRRWLAAGENRSGVSWRGHTSMKQAKKPLGIRLAEPHGFWGTTNVSKINLVNPFRDPSYLRNRLSYDLFQRFGGPDQRRDGLPGDWAEVFVNGKYFGLYETCPPVRAEWLGLEPYGNDEDQPTLIFKAQANPPSLSPDRKWFMRQTEPSRRQGSWMDEAINLQRKLTESSTTDFVANVETWLDLDNLLDFHLLLNFTENYNGWPFHHIIHDILVRPAGQQRYFLVPYDFDTTWDPHPVGLYHTVVFTRLMNEFPGYNERLARRWRELRQGPLDLAALESDIRQHEARLQHYVVWNDQRWPWPAKAPYADRVNELWSNIQRRIAELDAQYAEPNPAAR